MANVPVADLSKEQQDELLCTYAALILHDDGADVTAQGMTKLIKAAGCTVEGYWPMLMAKMINNVGMDALLKMGGGGGGGGGAPAAGGGGGGGAAGGSGGDAGGAKEEKKKAAPPSERRFHHLPSVGAWWMPRPIEPLPLPTASMDAQADSPMSEPMSDASFTNVLKKDLLRFGNLHFPTTKDVQAASADEGADGDDATAEVNHNDDADGEDATAEVEASDADDDVDDAEPVSLVQTMAKTQTKDDQASDEEVDDDEQIDEPSAEQIDDIFLSALDARA